MDVEQYSATCSNRPLLSSDVPIELSTLIIINGACIAIVCSDRTITVTMRTSAPTRTIVKVTKSPRAGRMLATLLRIYIMQATKISEYRPRQRRLLQTNRNALNRIPTNRTHSTNEPWDVWKKNRSGWMSCRNSWGSYGPAATPDKRNINLNNRHA